MTDLHGARELLFHNNYTCVLKKDDIIYPSRQRGISPLYSWYTCGMDFSGFSAADKVVGKATAVLYILLNVKAVYSAVISRSAFLLLKNNGIVTEYEEITDNIINRKGDGICPFEEAILQTDDIFEAIVIIKNKFNELSRKGGI